MTQGSDKPVDLSYHRVLLKISGEYFASDQETIDPNKVQQLAYHIQSLTQLGVQVAVVLGAGNLCRGKTFAQAGFDQVAADHMGMLATVMNALALRTSLVQQAIPAVVQSAFAIHGIVAGFNRDQAIELLANNNVVICAGGTGNPLVTTDTAAALRAIELKADVLLKATKVDGVYSADPTQDTSAILYDQISYQQVINQRLAIMDTAAFCLVRDHQMPVRIFNMNMPNIFSEIVQGVQHGTIVH